jgi:hypothetical protein
MALALAALLSILVFSTAVAAAKRPPRRPAAVPPGFVGVNLVQPLFPPGRGIDLAHQMNAMVASGVQSIRVNFDWATAQPYASWSDVPPAQRSQFTDAGGIPTRWGPFDQVVRLAADRGLTVLPTVMNAPSWDGVSGPGSFVNIPGSPFYYANFLTDLIDRYGPHGTFWARGTPKLPIEMWQIWNEPNLIGYWYQQPFQHGYVQLLKAARNAIRIADPHAKVVLAGFPNYSWGYIERIYNAGGLGSFDIAAIHPYTAFPRGVITIAGKVRQAMDTHGDRGKPMLITESGWTSSLGRTRHIYDFETTEAGQAQNLAQLLALLGRNRARLRLLGFFWYDWADLDQPGRGPFSYSGLFRISGDRFIAKPAFAVFRRGALALERCRVKGVRATVCRRH